MQRSQLAALLGMVASLVALSGCPTTDALNDACGPDGGLSTELCAALARAANPDRNGGKHGSHGNNGAADNNGSSALDAEDAGAPADADLAPPQHARHGAKGVDGEDGAHGAKGVDGEDGAHGAKGVDGVKGLDGAEGKDGENVIHGADAVDGVYSLGGGDGGVGGADGDGGA